MKIAAMSPEMLEFLTQAKAIRQRNGQQWLGPALVMVDGRRSGLRVEILTRE